MFEYTQNQVQASSQKRTYQWSDIPLVYPSTQKDLYSMSHATAIVAAAGFSYSWDARDINRRDFSITHITTEPDVDFYPEHEALHVQVKCTSRSSVKKDDFLVYQLDRATFNILCDPKRNQPRILVVVLVPDEKTPPIQPWVECSGKDTVLRHRAYWLSLMNGYEPLPPDRSDATVKVPLANAFDISSVRTMMVKIANGDRTL